MDQETTACSFGRCWRSASGSGASRKGLPDMATDSRIRVLHLGSPTGLYGAEQRILALLNNMDRSRVDSIVAVIRDDPTLGADLCTEAGRQGFRTRVFEAHGKVNWSAVRMLKAYLRQERIDVLHTHGYKTDVIGLLAARGTLCKLVSTPHGWSKQAGLKLRLYEAARIAVCSVTCTR